MRCAFDDGLIKLIKDSSFKVTCVVIDKQRHLETYAEHAFHPYHYCLAALLDRYCGWLSYKNAVGDVMAESRGGQPDRQLKEAYQRVYGSGTLMFPAGFHSRVLTSREIKVKSKQANIAGLQLADVLAHPMKSHLCELKNVAIGRVGSFAKRMQDAALTHCNRNEYRGTVLGYGLVWL